jgi:hypothetical protein
MTARNAGVGGLFHGSALVKRQKILNGFDRDDRDRQIAQHSLIGFRSLPAM